MKCPKCGYFGPDYLNVCKKCGKELFAEKAKLGLSSSRIPGFKPRPIPRKQSVPRPPSSDVPVSAEPLQEKTSPLFSSDPPELLVAPFSEGSTIQKQDFSTKSSEVKFEGEKKKPGEALKTAFLFETKHEEILPLPTLGKDTQNMNLSPNDAEDFEFPEDLAKNQPPLSVLSSEEELFLPDEPGREKMDSLIDKGLLHEKDETNGLLSFEERGKTLGAKNPLPSQSPGEAPPGGFQTEYLDDEEISRILEDINHGPSEPGTSN